MYFISGGKVSIGEPIDLVDAIREALKDKLSLPKETKVKNEEINKKEEKNVKEETTVKKEESVKTEESKEDKANYTVKESHQNVEEVEVSKKSKRSKV